MRGGVIMGSSLSSADQEREERERIRLEGGGMQDNEFDLERDNERTGIKIRKRISSPKLRTGSDVRDHSSDGRIMYQAATYRHDSCTKMKRPHTRLIRWIRSLNPPRGSS